VSETIKETNDYQDKLNKINGSKADTVKQKLHSYFSNIEGFKVMCQISCILEGEDLVVSDDLKDLSVTGIVCYKYVTMVSYDVEHAFSEFKLHFCDKQHRFMMHNLRMTFVTHCNSASLSV
jgi:hypothetical protein